MPGGARKRNCAGPSPKISETGKPENGFSSFVTFCRLLHAADFFQELQLRETSKIAKDAKKRAFRDFRVFRGSSCRG
jgi:hypothetical protein